MFEDFQPELLNSDFVAYSSPERRDELSHQCRANVVAWRWASGDMAFAFRRPFAKEQYRVKPAWLSAGNKPKPGNLRHGLGADGTIHVIEDLRFNDKFDESHAAPTYVIYGNTTIEAIRFHTHGYLESVQRRIYDGDRLARQHSLILGTRGSEEHYDWADDRLSRIVKRWWKTDPVGPGPEMPSGFQVTSVAEDRFIYDALGRLERIEEYFLNEDGSINRDVPTEIRYQRPRKNESISQLAKEIERMLLEEIPIAVAKARGSGPFYCLILCYCGEDFGVGWPPALVLKKDEERKRIIERGKEVTYYLWAPDESEDANVRVALRDDLLERHCELHCQLMDVKEDYSSAKKVLRSVAKALNGIGWSSIIDDVTPDFVVAALDSTDASEFDDDIKGSIPPQKLKALKQRGFI